MFFFFSKKFLYVLFLKMQEKAPFVAKAAKRKADYDKSMAAYNKKVLLAYPPREKSVFSQLVDVVQFHWVWSDNYKILIWIDLLSSACWD